MTRLIIPLLAISIASIAHAATTWTEQEGWYKKEISSKGKVRYVLTDLPDPEPTNDPCVQTAQFKCDSDWGVVFKIDEGAVGACNRVAIRKADLSDMAIYSGLQVINGQVSCQP